MAITRFFSDSSTPVAANNVTMNPEMAAAPAMAQLQAANQSGQDLQYAAQVMAQNEAKQAQLDKIQNAPDKTYLAQAKSTLEIGMNDAYNATRGSIKPNGQYVDTINGSLAQISKPLFEGAPNAATKQALAQTILSFQTGATVKANNLQNAINKQDALQGLSRMSADQGAYAARSPEQEASSLNRIDEYSKGLLQKGFTETEVSAHTKSAKEQLRYTVGATLADTDPTRVLDSLQSGAYDDLGPSRVATLVQRANNTLKAQANLVGKKVGDSINTLAEGGPVSPDWHELAKDSALIGKTDEAKALMEMVALKGSISDKPLNILRNTASELKLKAASDGTLNTGFINKQIKMVENQAKNLVDDPLQYSVASGTNSSLPEMPTPDELNTPVGQQKLTALQLAASKASEVYGVNVPLLTKSRALEVADKFSTSSPDDQVKLGQYLSTFGVDSVKSVAQHVSKKDPALTVGLMLAGEDPDTAKAIMQGNKLIKEGVVSKDMKAIDPGKSINSVLGNTLFKDDPQIKGQFLAAAKAYQSYKISGGDSISLEDSIRAVAHPLEMKSGTGWFGGDTYTTIAPVRGMDADKFKNVLTNIQEPDLMKYGNGIPVDSAGKLKMNEDGLSKFELHPAADGQYYLHRYGQNVKNSEGIPYIIDMKRYIKDTQQH